MKNNLKQLYYACILAFASEDDEIMNSALKAFEAELRQRLRRYEKRMQEGNRSDAIFYPALLICDILGIEDESQLPSRTEGEATKI
jgi:hypothetical protein